MKDMKFIIVHELRRCAYPVWLCMSLHEFIMTELMKFIMTVVHEFASSSFMKFIVVNMALHESSSQSCMKFMKFMSLLRRCMDHSRCPDVHRGS